MGLTLSALATLALLATLVGRLVVRLLRVSWLDRTHPDVLPLQAALGTAAITLAAATASHVGLGQRRALPWLIVGVAVLGVACLRAGGPRHARGRPVRWLPLFVAVAAAAVVALLPVVWLNAFNPFNDASYYNAVSDWLMDHGVRETIPLDPVRPVQTLVAQVVGTQIRLGTSYLQALLTAAAGVSPAMRLFPVVSAWGFVLLAGCLYSLGRRALRMSPWLCCAAVCTVVCVPAGMSHALQAGFQAELYGVSALVALVCAVAGLVPRRRWTAGGCVLAALLLAWQTSVYSELLPVAIVVLLSWVPATLCSARRRTAWRAPAVRRAWWGALLLTCVAWLGLSHMEALRAIRAIPFQLKAVVGWHVDLHDATWLGLLTGGSVQPELAAQSLAANPMRLLGAPLLPLGLALAALLFGRARHLLHGLRMAVVVLALLAAWYAWVARDPWTGERLHTWSLLKVTEWMQPFVLLAAWGGAALLLRGRKARAVAAVAGVGALVWGLPLHVAYARTNSCDALAEFTLSDRPLDELTRLSDRMAQFEGDTLYLVTRPEYTQPRFVEQLALLAPRSRMAGSWAGCHYLDGLPGLQPELADRVPQCEALTLLAYRPHVPIPGSTSLGAGVVAVHAGVRPMLMQIGGERLLETGSPGKPGLRIGSQPLYLVVFAPREGEVCIDMLAEPSGEPTEARWVEYGAHDLTQSTTLHFGSDAPSAPLRLHVRVVPGVNEITIRCRNPAGEATEEQPGVEWLSCTVPRLTWDEDVAN